jgi:hypothetical protein
MASGGGCFASRMAREDFGEAVGIKLYPSFVIFT